VFDVELPPIFSVLVVATLLGVAYEEEELVAVIELLAGGQ
jgi:hypothetical protein